ncbi:unnamed protein product, partial [Citrullus colocynthis]
QEDFRFQQDIVRLATETRVEMQLMRLEESQLELHHFEITETPCHELMYFDDEEDDEDPEPWRP